MTTTTALKWCALLLLSLTVGCGTTPARQSLQVRMTHDGGGTISSGRSFNPGGMAKALKDAGATRTTRIQVTLPADATPETIQAFSRSLARAGYPMVHFRTRKRAVSYVE